jgi:hypothetical protein
MKTQLRVLLLGIIFVCVPEFTWIPTDLSISSTLGSPKGTTGNIYYVSPTGNDSNPGTIDSPWKTPWKAGSTAMAGDTVIFRGGVYNDQLMPKNSGSPSDGWIIFKAYPGEEPIIIHDTYWSRAINIDGVNFIEVNGLTAVAAGQNGPGIVMNNAHHIRIINCTVRNSATTGIGTTYGIDYITIEGNRVFGNSNIGQYNGSGIGTWNSGGPIYDNAPGYHIIIRNNFIYDNRNLTDRPTDGNGIILDNNDHGSTPDLQNPKTLIANNVIFNNGGRCIHVLNSSNADIVNNTCYHNLETNRISDGCNGEISLQRTYSYNSAVNLQVYNNVVYGKGGTCNDGREQAYVFQVFCSNGCPQFTSDYNLWHNGAVYQLGSHDIVADPEFVNPSSDPESADFRLLSTSQAIDSGTDQFAQTVPTDFLGISRPQGEGFDRGAYEFQLYSVTVTLAGSGGGLVTGNGINCGTATGTDCSKTYDYGTSVTIKATPDSSSDFAGWSGACSGMDECTVTVDAAKNVTATFNLKLNKHKLSVSLAGDGSGLITSVPAGIHCGTYIGADCSETYNYGTRVTLMAIPDIYTDFAGWSGACFGTGDCTVNMTADRMVTATFGSPWPIPPNEKFVVFLPLTSR